MPGPLRPLLLLLLLLPGISPAGAAETVRIGFLGVQEAPRQSLSFTDPVIRDGGLQGARLGVADNDTTGRFMGQDFELAEAIADEGGSAVEAARELLGGGVRLIVADLPADALLEVAALPEAQDALILNARAKDDRLRRNQCRANLLHTMPSHAMLADALGQFLTARQWMDWFLVEGQGPDDKGFADALRRTAKRLRADVVVDKKWTFDVGNARTDDGFTNERDVVKTFTQGSDYDVLLVADGEDRFGDYLSHRTHRPRPVAGTQELVATNWSRAFESWGGTQLQNRFLEQAGRPMAERDHAAWVAVRAVGEAATRTKSTDPADLAEFIRSPDFALAAFKGQALSFRPWDGQLRQPILIANPRMLVGISPQEGFLHPRTPLDTLGDDEAEGLCKAG